VTALVSILAVAVILLGILVVGLLRSHAEILRALHRLGVNLDPAATDHAHGQPARPPMPPPAGEGELGPAADITGVTPSLEPVAVSVTGAGRLTLLAFLSSSCLTCRAFWEAFADPDVALPGDARLVVVARGADSESPAEIARSAPPAVTTVLSSEAWETYHVPGSPYFVLVDGSEPRIIGEGTGTGWEQVAGLLASALGDAGLAGRVGPGAPHPPSGRDNPARIDAELRAAGITPGHPSLHEGGDENGGGAGA
jgi:hypothetical protein